jgi:hypothetical protein
MIGSSEDGQHLPTLIKPGVEPIYSGRISSETALEWE